MFPPIPFWRVDVGLVRSHELVCPQRTVNCFQCQAPLPASRLADHLTETHKVAKWSFDFNVERQNLLTYPIALLFQFKICYVMKVNLHSNVRFWRMSKGIVIGRTTEMRFPWSKLRPPLSTSTAQLTAAVSFSTSTRLWRTTCIGCGCATTSQGNQIGPGSTPSACFAGNLWTLRAGIYWEFPFGWGPVTERGPVQKCLVYRAFA